MTGAPARPDLEPLTTEDEAPAALGGFVAIGEVEQWIAAQRSWKAAPSGWAVPGDLHGWHS